MCTARDERRLTSIRHVKHFGRTEPFSSKKRNRLILGCIKGKVEYIRTSGKFGHTFANSVNPDETAPYDFHCLLN